MQIQIRNLNRVAIAVPTYKSLSPFANLKIAFYCNYGRIASSKYYAAGCQLSAAVK